MQMSALQHSTQDIPNLLPRLEHSFGVFNTGNMLIHGDNLPVLQALGSTHAGQVQCIYIDPPYNTGNAFAHYHDDRRHQDWLDMMGTRIECMRSLLKPEGYFFCSIDENEMAYLKVLCDKVFGRGNFIGTLIWEKKRKPSFLSHLAHITEYILVYAKDRGSARPLVHGSTTKGKKYPINNAGNPLRVLRFEAGSVRFGMPDQRIAPMEMSEGNIVTRLLDPVVIQDGKNRDAFRLEGEWRYSQQKLDQIMAAGEELLISKLPFRPNHIRADVAPKKMKNLLSVAHFNLPTYEDATEETLKLFPDAPFDYPKPEKLILTLIEASTRPGDLVLDAFLGSGTTAAVAHKSGRKWIGIEAGMHCLTHAAGRLKLVCQGMDGGGVSKETAWTGGGGFMAFSLQDR